MKLKKILVSVSALAVLGVGVPCGNFNVFNDSTVLVSAETLENGLVYSVNDEGTGITITGCDTSITEIEIPVEIDGLSVTSIGENAFYFCYSLTDVYFQGTEEEWNSIEIYNEYYGNDDLLTATIHFLGEEPATTEETTTTNNIATDEELCEWAINDYQIKAGIMDSNAEITSISDNQYEITLTDDNGIVLDVYVIYPETGVGTDTENQEVNLPQTDKYYSLLDFIYSYRCRSLFDENIKYNSP